MFENLNFGKTFDGLFGKIGEGMCRLTINGGIAVKTNNGYKVYNVETKRLTNVNNFCFDAGDFFFVLPTAKVKVGDIILVDKLPKCVVKVDTEFITVIDYENSEIRQVVPERHILMGNTYFYGKIVSMFGNMKGKNMLNMMMRMMMMKSMFGNNNCINGANGINGIMQMMMFQNMFTGKNDCFNFENMFDDIIDNEDDIINNEDDIDNDKEETHKVINEHKVGKVTKTNVKGA